LPAPSSFFVLMERSLRLPRGGRIQKVSGEDLGNGLISSDMLSTPAVHKLFFFISMLFGMETSLVSQESELLLDREAKTGRIEYRRILVPKDRANEMDSVLGMLDGKERFDERLEGIRLTMSILASKKGQLAVDVFFEYDDEKAVRKAFGLEEEGGKLLFRAAERDSIISSNADREGRELSWNADAEKLRLKLSGRPLEKEERGSMTLVRYVER
jgi:hypothetical protein